MKHLSDLSWLWKNPNGDIAERATIQLHCHEAALLWKYCNVTHGGILEIGRRRGGSTTLLLEATEGMDRPLTSVDITSELLDPDCMSVFDKHKSRFNLITAPSHKACIEHGYDLLFIDGDHTYKGVRTDVLTHWDNLMVGGYALFHDYGKNSKGKRYCHNSGVDLFCYEWTEQGHMEKVEVVRSMAAFRKIAS
tara:strand:- start:1957 stop:2535 length:579 start_codon:yes stop_codon:yes gene_type:complete